MKTVFIQGVTEIRGFHPAKPQPRISPERIRRGRDRCCRCSICFMTEAFSTPLLPQPTVCDISYVAAV